MPGRASAATVYASVRGGSNLDADSRAGALMRVDLVAELLGARMPIGAAFLPFDGTGVAITATGFVVDGWHVAVSSNQPKLEVDIRLATDHGCCGGGGQPHVVVPQIWRPTRLREDQVELVDAGALFPSQLEQETGLWRLVSIGNNATFSVPAGERVTYIHSRANAIGLGSLTVPNKETTTTIDVADFAWLRLSPKGSMIGPCDIVTTGTAIAAVELVR